MALPYDNTQIKQQLRPVPFTDESQPLYDASGTYVGHGGKGKVVTEGNDPTAGGIQKVVTAGEQAIDQQIESQAVNPNDKPLSKVFNWGGTKADPQGKVDTETREAVPNPAPDSATATPDADADADATKTNTSTGTDANRTPAKTDRHQRTTINTDGTKATSTPTKKDETSANADNKKDSKVLAFEGDNINPYTGLPGSPKDPDADKAAPNAPANSQAGIPKEDNTKGDTDTEDPYAVTKEQYDAIKAKDPKDWTRQEALQVATYEHKPSAPADGDTYTPTPPPAYIAFNGNYNDAYKRMLDLMKANGDDPETKAKRAKARRAAKTIALLGDALAALANIWAASRGATSAKLSSASKAVADETNREEALALKRAEKYTKMLEDGRKADRDMEKIINARALAEWKELTRAGQKAHDSKTAGAWKEFEKRFGLYQARINQVNSHYDQLERQANQARLTDENNERQHQRRLKEQAANNAAKVKLKQTPAANSSGGSTQAL